MPGVDSEYYNQADEHARMHNRPIRDPKAMLWEQISELKARNAELVAKWNESKEREKRIATLIRGIVADSAITTKGSDGYGAVRDTLEVLTTGIRVIATELGVG